MIHTPEPWTTKEAKTGKWDSDGDIAIIAEIDGIPHIIAECFKTTAYGTTQPVRENAQLFLAGPTLLRVVDALLLFHSALTWDSAKAAQWKELTGTDECTTRNLCDFARSAIAIARGE